MRVPYAGEAQLVVLDRRAGKTTALARSLFTRATNGTRHVLCCAGPGAAEHLVQLLVAQGAERRERRFVVMPGERWVRLWTSPASMMVALRQGPHQSKVWVDDIDRLLDGVYTDELHTGHTIVMVTASPDPLTERQRAARAVRTRARSAEAQAIIDMALERIGTEALMRLILEGKATPAEVATIDPVKFGELLMRRPSPPVRTPLVEL